MAAIFVPRLCLVHCWWDHFSLALFYSFYKNFWQKFTIIVGHIVFVSYAKLLQSIITVFSVNRFTVHSPRLVVWAFDGNIGYLSPKHIPLFVVALVTLLLLWLPYTAILLSAQWLRTQTHRKGLHWLKPFLDAYYGPFKDKHHYWVGVLLVVRGVLFLSFALLAGHSNTDLLLVSFCSIALITYLSVAGRLYKKLYLSVLENSFFLNLGVLAAGTLYIGQVGGSQEALVTTSVGIAFLQFVGITGFHAFRFVINPIRFKYKKVSQKKREDLYNPAVNQVFTEHESHVITHTEVSLSDLQKEPNLTDATSCTVLSDSTEAAPADIPLKEPSDPLPSQPIESPNLLANANEVYINENTIEILIPSEDTPGPNTVPLNQPAVSEAAGAPPSEQTDYQPEAAAANRPSLILPPETIEPLRRGAAAGKRECFPYDDDSFREPWLELFK